MELEGACHGVQLSCAGTGTLLGYLSLLRSWKAITSPLGCRERRDPPDAVSQPAPHLIHVSLVAGTGLLIGHLAVRVTAHEQ